MPGAILSGTLPGVPELMPFRSHGEARKHLKERGFAVESARGRSACGFVFGAVTNPGPLMRPIERNAMMHGQIIGNPRKGSAMVALYPSAPPEALAALQSPVPTHPSRLLERSADLAVAAMLVFALGSVLFVGWGPMWRSHPPTIGEIIVGKHTNRAGPIGLQAAAAEARR